MLTFSPRGIRPSGGTFTYANALDDRAAAMRWLNGPEGRRFGVDPATVALGGHSFGGGVAMVYDRRSSGAVRRDMDVRLAARPPRRHGASPTRG